MNPVRMPKTRSVWPTLLVKIPQNTNTWVWISFTARGLFILSRPNFLSVPFLDHSHSTRPSQVHLGFLYETSRHVLPNAVMIILRLSIPEFWLCRRYMWIKIISKWFQPSSTSVWNNFAWNDFKVISEAYCSSWIFFNTFNVAKIISK